MQGPRVGKNQLQCVFLTNTESRVQVSRTPFALNFCHLSAKTRESVLNALLQEVTASWTVDLFDVPEWYLLLLSAVLLLRNARSKIIWNCLICTCQLKIFFSFPPPGIIQFSWRINAHGGVKPHGAVSIGKPFPCVTKYCHFSVVPDCSHSPVSQLPEWFSRKDQTCDKLNPRLSLCLVLENYAFGRHPRGLWLRALLALLWCRTGVSERYPSGRCSLHRCVPDKPVCWTYRWSTAEIVSQTREPGVYRVWLEGEPTWLVQFLLGIFRVEWHIWTTTFCKETLQFFILHISELCWSCYADSNCNCKFSACFSLFLIQWELCLCCA